MSDSLMQKQVDKFYHKNGKCCAGCDHWEFFSKTLGECKRSAPVSASERISMIGMESLSLNVGAGHIITPRDNVCGEFVDTYDWGKK